MITSAKWDLNFPLFLRQNRKKLQWRNSPCGNRTRFAGFEARHYADHAMGLTFYKYLSNKIIGNIFHCSLLKYKFLKFKNWNKLIFVDKTELLPAFSSYLLMNCYFTMVEHFYYDVITIRYERVWDCFLSIRFKYFLCTMVKCYLIDLQQDCPNGRLTPAKFVDMYKMFFPSGNAEEFCDHVFRTFDMDKNGYIDFKVSAISTLVTLKCDNMLAWAFSNKLNI